MAATISANSAGGGGLVTSGDASGVLALQTVGVTALSISAAQVVSFTNPIPSAALPAGSVLQVVQTLNNANTSGSVAIPNDNTIPQITEGTQYLTCTIVPKSATSKLLVQVMLYIAEPTNAGDGGAIALFRDATASAIAVGALIRPGSGLDGGFPSGLSILTPSNSTSSTTFTVRAGLNLATALVMNTNTDGAYPKWGGVYYSGITITEVAA